MTILILVIHEIFVLLILGAHLEVIWQWIFPWLLCKTKQAVKINGNNKLLTMFSLYPNIQLQFWPFSIPD